MTATRRTALHAAAVVLPAVLAGCSSSSSTPSETTTPESTTRTQTDTQTPTDTRTPKRTTGTADPTTVSPENVIDYRNLTDDSRRLFRTLVENESTTRPADRLPSGFLGLEHVRYDGALYGVDVERTGMIAEYTVQFEPVDESAIEDESELVRFGNLSEEGRSVVEVALTDGRYSVRDGTLPDDLYDHRYVAYRDEYYERRIVVADIPTWRLTVRNASE